MRFRGGEFSAGIDRSEIGGTVLSGKICKAAKKRHTTKDVVTSVALGMHPLNVVLDLWSQPIRADSINR